MTYHEVYNKVIDAYFNDEIKPYHMYFCFCGTVANAKKSEFFLISWDNELYTQFQYHDMETALLGTIRDICMPEAGIYITAAYGKTDELRQKLFNHPKYEDALFLGMCAALDVVKKIHIEGGEIIDEIPMFEKRKIQSKILSH